MKLNLIGPFVVNAPFGTEIAFSKGLRQLGHEVNEVDPNCETYTPEDADATIVFKSCVGNEEIMLPYLRHPVIVYQPDDARFPHIREMMMRMRAYSDLFLSFDAYGATVARQMGYSVAQELLLTADPELYSPSSWPIERDIDVSFIGSLGDPSAHASRRRMIQIAQNLADARGWKTHWEVSQDIPHVVDVYRRSKVVLNHATDVGQPFGWGYGVQCRHFEVGMTKTCLLSNATYSASDMPFWSFGDEAELVNKLQLIIDSGNYAEEGQLLYDSIARSHMPVHRAQQLIDFIERNA